MHLAARPSGSSRMRARQPEASRPTPDIGERIRITFKDRQWHLHRVAEHLVRDCLVCTDALADSALCSDIRHRLCRNCVGLTLQAGAQAACPTCQRAPMTHEQRHALDTSLAEPMRHVRLQCAECQLWSGPLTEVDAHIHACKQRQHPCPWQSQGCTWTGLLEVRDRHAYHCCWQPVNCSHQNCRQPVPLRDKEAHEAGCRHRPISLGALQTTYDTTLRLEAVQLFCQRHDRQTLSGLPEATVREQLHEMKLLFPLLYQAVHTAPRTPEYSMACRWGCDFHNAPAEQLEVHYRHCPLVPVNCQHCNRGIHRRELVQHSQNCELRPVACPQGCGAPDLRARDINTGVHTRSCKAVAQPCGYCTRMIPALAMITHERQCNQRPQHCCWCLDTHMLQDFETLSRNCRRALATAPDFNGERLMPHPQAVGPVYITPAERYDPVFIHLPTPPLIREMARDTTGSTLTPALRFMWAGMDCQLDIAYIPHYACFTCTLYWRQSTVTTGSTALAGLYNMDGELIEQLGAQEGRRRSSALPALTFLPCRVSRFDIKALNRIAYGRELSLLLKLGPLASP